MSKIKNFIRKIKSSLYGVVGRTQFPDQLTIDPPEESPVAVKPAQPSKKATPKKSAPKKVASDKTSTPAKKPGRPKKSVSPTE